MATINLGAIKFNWKGAYAGGTAYAVDDVVSSGGSSYVCILASTGNATSNGTYWELMSSAGTNGTNGTDVGTTLTTQGDILYRDGSGLQRLPKGTANQVLKMNSGATAPEYGNLSSDFVKLASATTTSNHQTIDVNGYFNDSIYSSYRLIFEEIRMENNSGHMTMKFLTSASATNDANNYQILGTDYRDGSGGVGGQFRADYNVNSTDGLAGTWNPRNSSASDHDYSSMYCDIINPQNTSMGKTINFKFNTFATTNNIMVSSSGHYFSKTSTAMTGVRLYRTSNGFLQSNWALYGIK